MKEGPKHRTKSCYGGTSRKRTRLPPLIDHIPPPTTHGVGTRPRGEVAIGSRRPLTRMILQECKIQVTIPIFKSVQLQSVPLRRVEAFMEPHCEYLRVKHAMSLPHWNPHGIPRCVKKCGYIMGEKRSPWATSRSGGVGYRWHRETAYCTSTPPPTPPLFPKHDGISYESVLDPWNAWISCLKKFGYSEKGLSFGGFLEPTLAVSLRDVPHCTKYNWTRHSQSNIKTPAQLVLIRAGSRVIEPAEGAISHCSMGLWCKGAGCRFQVLFWGQTLYNQFS